jgi:hypothetical protein
MPFLFVYVCDLLEQLGSIFYRDCPLLTGLEKETNRRTVNWLKQHRHRLNEFSVDSAAVMMFFTPEKYTDRDYGLDAERLGRLIARLLNLSRDLYADLQLWRERPGHGDLGACVQRVMDKSTSVSGYTRDYDVHLLLRVKLTLSQEMAPKVVVNKVTVEEIDQALLKIASHNPNSSLEVRSLAPKVRNHDTIELLGKIYRSLGGREAKWLTRFILKDYGPLKFPELLDFSPSMQFLPSCVRVNAQVAISGAIPTLRDGTGVIKATQTGVTSLNRGATSPWTASPTRERKLVSAEEAVISLPTPPTTAPPLPSPTAILTPSSINLVRLQHREPLAPLNLNSSSSRTQCSSGDEAQQPSSLTAPLYTTPKARSSPMKIRNAVSPHHSGSRCLLRTSFQQAHPSSSKASSPITVHGTGTCVLTTNLCPLTNCIFLLAPCISSSPWITENILSWHGCRTITSLDSFSDSSLRRRCPRTGKRYRKIALVEINRTKPTVELMRRIERLNLHRSRGKKEWVEVYDWRILEAIAKADRGQDKGYNPWRRCWIGAV